MSRFQFVRHFPILIQVNVLILRQFIIDFSNLVVFYLAGCFGVDHFIYCFKDIFIHSKKLLVLFFQLFLKLLILFFKPFDRILICLFGELALFFSILVFYCRLSAGLPANLGVLSGFLHDDSFLFNWIRRYNSSMQSLRLDIDKFRLQTVDVALDLFQ